MQGDTQAQAQAPTQEQQQAVAQAQAQTQSQVRAQALAQAMAQAQTPTVVATTKANEVNTGATDAAIANQVAQEVREAAAQGADAAQLMTLAHERSVELVREQYPNAPPTERMDRAMAIATYVLCGTANIEDLAKADSGTTQTVQYMRDIQANDPNGTGFAGQNLDKTNGGGTFYDAYSDGTPNQAFHTGFFIAAGYVAGGDPKMIAAAQAGNLYHETWDDDAKRNGGGSFADYAASATGIIAGSQLAQARQHAAEFEAGLHPSGGDMDLMQPVIVAGFVSDAGTPAPQVAGMTEAQQQGAQQAMAQIADYRGSWLYQLATEKNYVAALPIWFFEIAPWLNGLKPDGIN